jgi:hypothetical protein
MPYTHFTAVPTGRGKNHYRVVEIAGVTGTLGDIKRWAAICHPGAKVIKKKEA